MPSRLSLMLPEGEFSGRKAGTKNEQMNPTTMPPIVISSGMMKCSKSMKVATIKPARKVAYMSEINADCRPNASQQPMKTTPVSSSTKKYRIEIGAPQFLHLPRRYNQVISGILKYQGMPYLQCGQWDGGETMLSPSGIR